MGKDSSIRRQEYEALIEAVRAALTEGENSGPAEPFDFEQFLTKKREKYGAR